ncbi:nucleolar complex protein 4 homolog [Macrosteles quadrilineatus]|uniref:nucleolar complex protein 4 homolog n=1 Tax=Macrosteles quadrilineatus TaxID=74068 RepID=UPI0023E149A7|nr:nucleolar complex protein 4 homolog [Macrosteles quadrilineatus]
MKRKSTETSTGKHPKKKGKCITETKLKEMISIFLSDKKHSNILIDILAQFQKPSETPATCVNAVESIFTEVLKRKDMAVTDSENSSEAESQYKDWLRDCYEEAWSKLLICLEKGKSECKLQSLNTLFKLLSIEAKFPVIKLKKKKKNNVGFPLHRLKDMLTSLYQSHTLSEEVLKRLSELFNYKDVESNLWLAADGVCKAVTQQNSTEKTLWNLLLVLSKLPKLKKGSEIVLCDIKNGVPEERLVQAAVERVWKKLSGLQCSPRTHQLLMVVLVEHIMPRMDNIIFLTDYLMDALERDECEISMIALQGIFNLVLKHNIEYPDIFGKLYQLFTPEALKAKYKARLFALADEFLRSTHLPLALVAGFAKRYARLLLHACPPDQVVLLSSMANLLIRHPDLKPLYHNPGGKDVAEDPYDEAEKDPVKSGALSSQLWEVKLMQHHHSDRVSRLAMVISNDLPSVEYSMDPVLDLTWEKMIEKEIKFLEKKIPQVAAKFQDKPLSSKMEEARQKEISLLWADFNKYFVC